MATCILTLYFFFSSSSFANFLLYSISASLNIFSLSYKLLLNLCYLQKHFTSSIAFCILSLPPCKNYIRNNKTKFLFLYNTIFSISSICFSNLSFSSSDSLYNLFCLASSDNTSAYY